MQSRLRSPNASSRMKHGLCREVVSDPSKENNMRHTMSGLTCALALGLLAFGAHAADPADKSIKQHYDAAIAQADADYKADAKGTRKSADATEDAREDKMAAEYKVAKEKCDSLSGDAKDACIKNAK